MKAHEGTPSRPFMWIAYPSITYPSMSAAETETDRIDPELAALCNS
jgi:hypothetical protein